MRRNHEFRSGNPRQRAHTTILVCGLTMAHDLFIQSALREWAYGRRYENSEQRRQALPVWTHFYNWHRGWEKKFLALFDASIRLKAADQATVDTFFNILINPA